MAKFEVKAQAKKQVEGERKRRKEIKSCRRLEEGVWRKEHTWTGALDVKVSWVLSLIETPYYNPMVTE